MADAIKIARNALKDEFLMHRLSSEKKEAERKLVIEAVIDKLGEKLAVYGVSLDKQLFRGECHTLADSNHMVGLYFEEV